MFINKNIKIGTLLVLLAALMGFASCKKIDLTVQIPQLKGSWQWEESAVGGVVGIIHADTTQNLVLTFEDDNKINVAYNGEWLFQNETYTVTKSNNSLYGDYIITVPKKIQTKVAECLGHSEGSIVLSGYVNLYDFMSEAGPSTLVKKLGILDKKGIENVEGGNYRKSSIFAPIHELY
ncbi:MAG: hypothetical protein IKI09_07370 [Bacteroidales bacterium]|nr:hypothetical protein [Bacteroidales bacterium]